MITTWGKVIGWGTLVGLISGILIGLLLSQIAPTFAPNILRPGGEYIRNELSIGLGLTVGVVAGFVASIVLVILDAWTSRSK